MLGKSFVSLQIGRLSVTSPPAVTLCYSGLYSMERAAIFQPSFKKINESYQNLFQNWKWREVYELYRDSFRNYTNNKLSKNGLNMNELFNKMSIKFNDLDGNPIISLKLSGSWVSGTVPDHLNVIQRKSILAILIFAEFYKVNI